MAYKWLSDRKERLDWILSWLLVNNRPPFLSDDSAEAVKLHKPNRYIAMHQYSYVFYARTCMGIRFVSIDVHLDMYACLKKWSNKT